MTEKEKNVINEIFGWVKRMSEKNGSIVISKDGTKYDWGQALCREQFGKEWQSYMIENNIRIPTEQDLEKAIKWENGEIPDWVEITEDNGDVYERLNEQL